MINTGLALKTGLLRLLAVGVLVAFTVALGSERGEASQLAFQSGTTGGVYAQNCGPCHGPAGEGGVAPSLQDSVMSNSDQIAIVRDGSPAMPAFGQSLTPDEINEVVSYIAAIAADEADVVEVVNGPALYAERCAACHGNAGGGGSGPSLQTSATPLAEQLAIVRNGQGSMPAFGSMLGEAELEAVTEFSTAFQAVSPDAASQDAQSIEAAGAGVYAGNCASCHGPEMQGGVGPNLSAMPLSDDELISIVNDGQGSMPGFADRIDADDLTALMAFIGGPVGADSPDSTSQEVLAHGARLFTQNCSRCHGSDASGGEGPALRTSTLGAAEMVPVISNGRGAMPSFSTLLTAVEIDTVVGYIAATQEEASAESSLAQAATPGQGAYLGTCAGCHGLTGEGGLGPALAGSVLTINEITSQIFGGHSDGMPPFEGVLDAVVVQEVGRYVLSLEETHMSSSAWPVYMGVALAVLLALAVLWYMGAFDQLRRRPEQANSQ